MAQAFQFSITLFDLHQHLIKVDLQLPANQQPYRLSLPSWIPGSYLVRDFAQHVHAEQCLNQQGELHPWEKVDKQTWHIAPSEQPLQFSYFVYAFDPSVRSAYCNDQYAFINGTSVFLQVRLDGEQQGIDDQQSYQFNLCDMPVDWQVSCTMSPAEQPHSYQASSYAEFIEHPILIGQLLKHVFMHAGVAFHLYFTGDTRVNLSRLEDDLRKIIQHHFAVFQAPHPISEYHFQTLVVDKGFGGLEHLSSTALMYGRDELLQSFLPEMTVAYRNFLSLCAHELWHTWHVKRIKPAVFYNQTLAHEVYTKQLWIYEGFTSFYDDFSLLRAGVIDAQQYLTVLGENITRLMRNPGRHLQSAADSSFEAWTKFYQQDASSTNRITSYYNKGGLIALCLDIYLRQQSEQRLSLDDVMRRLWQDYGRPQIGTEENVIEQICQQLGIDASHFIQTVVYGTTELPLATLLAEVGVELSVRYASNLVDKGGKASKQALSFDPGFTSEALATGIKITQVIAGGTAQQLGLFHGDQLIAINNWQISQQNLYLHLSQYHPGDNLQVTVLRDGRLLQLATIIEAGQPQHVYCQLVDADKFAVWTRQTTSN